MKSSELLVVNSRFSPSIEKFITVDYELLFNRWRISGQGQPVSSLPNYNGAVWMSDKESIDGEIPVIGVFPKKRESLVYDINAWHIGGLALANIKSAAENDASVQEMAAEACMSFGPYDFHYAAKLFGSFFPTSKIAR